MMGLKVTIESAHDLENQCDGNQQLADQIGLPEGGLIFLKDPSTELFIQTNFHVDSSILPNLLRVAQNLLHKLNCTGTYLVIEPSFPFSSATQRVKSGSIKVPLVKKPEDLNLEIPIIPSKNKTEFPAQMKESPEDFESSPTLFNQLPNIEVSSPSSMDTDDILKEQLYIPPIPKKREGGIKTSPRVSEDLQTITPSIVKTEPSSPIARQLEEKIQHIEKIDIPSEKIDTSFIPFLNKPNENTSVSEVKEAPFTLSSAKPSFSEPYLEPRSSKKPEDYSAQEFVTRLIMKNSEKLVLPDATIEDSLPSLPTESFPSVPVQTPQTAELAFVPVSEQQPSPAFNTIMLVDISRSMMARDVRVQFLEASIEKLKNYYNASEVTEFLGQFKPNVFVPRRFAAAFAVILYVLEKINRGLDERISVIRYADEPQVLPWKNQGWIQTNRIRPDEVLEVIKVVIRDIAYSYGQATNMGMAIQRAQDVITLFQKQMPFQSITLINLTDGTPTDENAYLKQVKILTQSPLITFHVVGLGNPDDALMMNTVASCHGKYIKPQDASELVNFYSEIARSIL